MTPQRMPPELLAITPPTQAMSVEAGSGPSLQPCGASTRLTWPSTVPGCDPRAGAVVLDRDAAEVAADVDQDPVGLALAVEARAAGAEDDRGRGAPAVGEHLGDVGRRRGPSPRPSGTAGRGWRRRRSGRCRRRAPSTRSAPSRATRSPRSGSGVPPATQSGAASALGGRAAPAPAARPSARAAPSLRPLRPARLEQPHPRRDADLDQLRPVGGDRAARAPRAARRRCSTAGRADAVGRRRSRRCRAAGRSSPGAPSTPSIAENHLRIAYSLFRSTRKVTGTS